MVTIIEIQNYYNKGQYVVDTNCNRHCVTLHCFNEVMKLANKGNAVELFDDHEIYTPAYPIKYDLTTK
jgi:hypothetical protein